ncbi:uncharacterized protein LOC111089698 [Limulus polyphemus]|uniref:Uncharacterized protein LOC111089698 n=1 Tax=Limulus polyphemus TaxID=6850 RepID=A0ABM1TR38_LIMPO|nr:uncharacterized protein LOC111089698 [Limulus polyphemus]
MSSSVTEDKPQTNRRARGPIYRFIRPSRSLRKELLTEHSSGTPEDHCGKEHHQFWKKATSFRQSLRGISDPKSSRLVRSVSQHQVENNDRKEWDRECGSQMNLSLSYNRKQHFQSKSRFSQDLEHSILLHKQSQSLSDNDTNPVMAVPNQTCFLGETNQISLNSSVTSLATQHLVFNRSELEHRTPHQRSPRKLTKDSGYETSAQGESDYINIDYLGEDGEKDIQTSSLTAVRGYSEPQTSQWASAHAVASSRLRDRSDKESKELSGSRLSTSCLLDNVHHKCD